MTKLCAECGKNNVHYNNNGEPSEFCSRQCQKDAVKKGHVKPCVICRYYPRKKMPDNSRSLYCCKHCKDLDVPHLKRLPNKSLQYKGVALQFIKAWKHEHKPHPQIHAIWQIDCKKVIKHRYVVYRNEVEKKRHLKGKLTRKCIMTAGNEQRRFHGTKITCHIGLGKRAKVCNDTKCSLCSIIKVGYKLKYAGHRYERFGNGIYFSGTSSKSDDYAMSTNSNGVNYKMMLLNKVVVGNGYELTVDKPDLQSPPEGYDSILGEAGINLNYDEVVFYKEAACLPRFLIVYGESVPTLPVPTPTLPVPTPTLPVPTLPVLTSPVPVPALPVPVSQNECNIT